MKTQQVDEALAVAQQTLEQWLSFRKFMLKAFSDDPLAAEEETNFLDVKSAMTRNTRALDECTRAAGKLDYGSKEIQELRNKCVSMQHLRGLPQNDRLGLYQEWHKVFVRLSRTVGAFKFMSEGFVPADPKKKKKGGKGGGGGKGAMIGVVVAVVVLGGAAAVYFLFLA
ncbi:MAG: hypothetical protein RLY93_20825 [Sumerlaeia bacterium]